MTYAWRIVASLVAAYLVGGIPFGVVVGRFHKVDITKMGSGNTGATNVFRSLGWKAGLITALADVAKGAAPAALALLLAVGWEQWERDLLVVATGCVAMAGHMYSPYFHLRGGKGIATAGGAVAVLMPKAFICLLAIFVLLVVTVRIVSVASISVALALPLVTWVFYPHRLVLLAFAGIGVPLVLWRHRGNIRRLFRGEEPRVQWKRAPQE